MKKDKQYYPELDGWKGIFAVLIALFHFDAFYVGSEPIKRYLLAPFITVEGFFIISGFLIAKSIELKSTSELIWSRVKKIWIPYIICLSISVAAFLNSFLLPYDSIKLSLIFPFLSEAFMLQMVGTFPATYINAPGWFVSSLFVGITILSLLSKISNKFFDAFIIITPIIIYNLFMTTELIDYPGRDYYILLGGNFRSIACLCIGVAIYKFMNRNIIHRIRKQFLYIIEVILLYLLVLVLFQRSNPVHVFFFIPLFIVSMIICLSQNGILSKILCNRTISWLGKISMNLYLVHYPISYLMALFYHNLDIPLNKYRFPKYCIALAIFIICAILLGHMTKLLDNLIRRYFKLTAE